MLRRRIGPNCSAAFFKGMSSISSSCGVFCLSSTYDTRADFYSCPHPSVDNALTSVPSCGSPGTCNFTRAPPTAVLVSSLQKGQLKRVLGGVNSPSPTTTDSMHHTQKRYFGEARHDSKEGAVDKRDEDVPITNWDVAKMIALNLWPENRWDLRARVIAAFTFVVATKSLKVCVPFWFKSVVDSLVPATAATGGAVTVGPITLGVFGMIAAYGVTRFTATIIDESKTVMFCPVNNFATNRIGMEVFRKLHLMDLNYHLAKQTGSLARDLDRGSRAFSFITFDVFFSLAPTAIEMALVCGMLYKHAGIEFVALALMAGAGYITWTYFITQWRKKFRKQFNDAESKLGGLIIDSLMNYETMKYFNTEEYEANRMKKLYGVTNEGMLKIETSMALLNAGQHIIFILAATTGLYLGASAVMAGTMTVGEMVMVDALLLQMYQPLQFLGIIYRELTSSTQNMEKMIGLLKADIKIQNDPSAVPLVFKKGDIELKNVSFGYSDQRPILEDISLKIPGGTTAAFVGPSGSGKTTIFRLLFRFFETSKGQVLIDGQDIRKVTMESLRHQYGVIPQDTVMFNDTIRHNIEYGRIGASQAQIEAAAKASQFDQSVAKFPAHYDTMVGERGLMLSGGEKQRLSIARVILRGSPILLADEATSALDSKTEANVMKTLNAADIAGRKRTVLMIAHRLSTIQNADQIFVLNGKGGLAESGGHDALIAAKGLYYQLWMRQLREAEIEHEKQLEEEAFEKACEGSPSPSTCCQQAASKKKNAKKGRNSKGSGEDGGSCCA